MLPSSKTDASAVAPEVSNLIRARLDACVQAGGELSVELAQLCEAHPDASWEMLALLDQYYRRGHLTTEQFQSLKADTHRRIFGVLNIEDPSEPGRATARPHSDADTQELLEPDADFVDPDATVMVTSRMVDPVRVAPHTANPDVTASAAPRMVDPDATVRVAPPVVDPDATVMLTSRRAVDPDATVRVAPRAADPDAPVRVEPRMVDPDATVRVAPRMADPDATVRVTEPMEVGGYQLREPRETSRAILVPGMVLRDRYVIEEPLDYGAVRRMFKALDRHRMTRPLADHHVAIKVATEDETDPQAVLALQDEFWVAESLSHPNIVNVFDLDHDGERHFMTMELIEGELLSEMSERLHPRLMSLSTVLGVVRDVGAALQYAHDRGVVHADLKPNNIMMTRTDGVRVLGFGVAAGASDNPVAAQRLGHSTTSPYASRERVLGWEFDPRDDLYSLACIVYELLSGRLPYAESQSTPAHRRTLSARRIRGLSRRQWSALRQGLAPLRQHRPRSVREWLGELELPEGTRDHRPRNAAHAIRLRSWSPVIAIGALVLVGALAYLMMTQPGRFPDLPQLPSADAARQFVSELWASIRVPDFLTKKPTAVPQEPPSESVAPLEKPAASSGELRQETSAARPTDHPAIDPRSSAPLANVSGPDAGRVVPPASEPTLDAGGSVPAAEGPAIATGSPTPTAKAPTRDPDPTTPAGEQAFHAETVAPSAKEAGAIAEASPKPAPPSAPAAPVAGHGPGVLSLAQDSYTVGEGETVVRLTVRRAGGGDGEVSFRWRTIGSSATPGEDFVAYEGASEQMEPGQQTAVLLAPLVSDGLAEHTELFYVEISDPDNGATLGATTRATVIIEDDD